MIFPVIFGSIFSIWLRAFLCGALLVKACRIFRTKSSASDKWREWTIKDWDGFVMFYSVLSSYQRTTIGKGWYTLRKWTNIAIETDIMKFALLANLFARFRTHRISCSKRECFRRTTWTSSSASWRGAREPPSRGEMGCVTNQWQALE